MTTLKTSAQSPELQAKLAMWKEKAYDGTITLEEMREAIAMMRGERRTAVSTPKASKAKAPKPETRSSTDLLNELKGL